MTAGPTQVVTVRLLPHVFEALQRELGLSRETGATDTMRAAITRLTSIPADQMTAPRGGRRPGAGRPPKRRAVA
ncbi:hypothetical protein ACGRHY_29995 [Streptomyces sp. HK10]|uniref:hypothetical protein n=1 Tax=Streptomyces sp. HK10 TaxID=3373255 RepID=UPI00374828F3